jgi:hypothetical protein
MRVLPINKLNANAGIVTLLVKSATTWRSMLMVGNELLIHFCPTKAAFNVGVGMK